MGRGNIIFRKTGLSVNPKDWSKKVGLPKQNNFANKNLTTQLRKLKTNILEKLNEANANGTDVSGDWVTHNIDLFFERITENKQKDSVLDNIQFYIDTAHVRVNGKGSRGLSKSRIGQYKRLQALFKEFEGTKNYKVKDMDKNLFDDFIYWLLDIDGKAFGAKYAVKKVTDLKTVCTDARSRGIETSPQLQDMKFKDVYTYDDDMDVITLTEEDIDKIEKAKLPSEALINARKWLILACYTGQRGKALTTRINPDNFEPYGNNYVIKIKQGKGNKPVTIPVLPKVREIYEEGMPYTVSPQKLNKHFKQIGIIAKINEMVMGRKSEKVNGKTRGIKKLRPKHQYMSTHIGRRTFIVLHHGKGMARQMIMKVTGHKKESTLLDYINQSDNIHIDPFLEFYEAKDEQTKTLKMKPVHKKAE